ncbi:DUF2789 domain-containing protein [Niveibacterium sp. COAC-50]|uniref:DUF2789 domain-containing protein n=1 Tax=Niveibacterium sp. COAC-50 TaxID=2729384 RepID=UPI0015527A83|nr:DUF2789 domain-containing protein [Niveibacterium sp. COAC-50]
MESHIHSMANLFSQLGLPAEPADIERFISASRPIGGGLTVECAPFWSEAQRVFLKEQIILDADWAGVIDELNSRLSK